MPLKSPHCTTFFRYMQHINSYFSIVGKIWLLKHREQKMCVQGFLDGEWYLLFQLDYIGSSPLSNISGNTGQMTTKFSPAFNLHKKSKLFLLQLVWSVNYCPGTLKMTKGHWVANSLENLLLGMVFLQNLHIWS